MTFAPSDTHTGLPTTVALVSPEGAACLQNTLVDNLAWLAWMAGCLRAGLVID